MRECPACKLCFPDAVANCPIDGDATLHSIPGAEPILEGKYQLEKRLGQGGMGVVYKARHNFLKTQHAIKVILPDLVGNDPNLVTRFRQEAIASAAVRHQNIVSVTDFGVVNGKMPFIVMEFVKGESLHDLLVREKRLSPEQSLEILNGICNGVSAAHRQDIVHRDLKPLNIMICADKPMSEAVKVLDFGLAKIKSGELLGSFVAAQTTGLMGSPYYMAPEQWSDDEPDARADVYSLGVMLFQMLAGDVPFKGSSIPSIMKKHLTDQPPPLASFGLNLPAEVEAVVHHALEKELTKRTASVEKLTNELRDAIGVSSARINQTSDSNLQVQSDAQTVAQIALPNAPRTTVQVLTVPPGAKVFLDNEARGASEASGWLTVENVARGKHRLKVAADGFFDYDGEIECREPNLQTVVQLRSLLATNVAAPADAKIDNRNPPPANQNAAANETLTDFGATNVRAEIALGHAANEPLEAKNFGVSSFPKPNFQKADRAAKFARDKQAEQTLIGESPRDTIFADEAPAKKRALAPILLGAGALLVVLIAAASFAALLFLPGKTDPTKNGQQNLAQSVSNANDAAKNDLTPRATSKSFKAEMVKIPGGTFMMGRNEGQLEARPAHAVTVADFSMDKTEVTNGEYAEFVKAAPHRAPEGWSNNNPPADELNLPVVSVSLDDAKAFAKWRSERDNAQYRVPSEAEWEYAARNGADATLFPWGNSWTVDNAVIDVSFPAAVGSMPNGANKWGVLDLIGNVWEWTDTKLAPYAGSNATIVTKEVAPDFVIRGGSIQSVKDGDKPITSALRQWLGAARRDKLLGFRLVKSEK